MRLLNGMSLADVSIERLREFEPSALAMHPDGYWLAYSGGKDSVVLLDLAKRAGVKFRAVYNATTVDPPELVRFIRQQSEVEFSHPPETMWQLIRRKGMPPRRNARFCCEVLKERSGSGHVVLTGVRWAESVRRGSRKMVEPCYRDETIRYLHPIIDWPTDAVWEYINDRNLRFCCLYLEGFTRLGCVLCPMSERTARDMKRWPRLCAAWERAVKATWKPRDPSKRIRFRDPEQLWQWWLDRKSPAPTDERGFLFGAGR